MGGDGGDGGDGDGSVGSPGGSLGSPGSLGDAPGSTASEGALGSPGSLGSLGDLGSEPGSMAAQAATDASMSSMPGFTDPGVTGPGPSIGPAVGVDAANFGWGLGTIGGFSFGPSIGVNGFGLSAPGAPGSIGQATVGPPSGVDAASLGLGFGNIAGFASPNEGFGMPGVNLGFNDPAALSQATIDDAMSQEAINAVLGVAPPGLSHSTPPSITGIPAAPTAMDAELGLTAAPVAPVSIPANLGVNQTGLFGIAPTSPNIPGVAPAIASPFGQLASFEAPPAHEAPSADISEALSEETESIAQQNIAAFNLAQQEQEAAALSHAPPTFSQQVDTALATLTDMSLNPTPVPTIAVAPQNVPKGEIPNAVAPPTPTQSEIDEAQQAVDQQAKEAQQAIDAINQALGPQNTLTSQDVAIPSQAQPAPPAPAIAAITGINNAPPGMSFAPAPPGQLGLNVPAPPAPAIAAITGINNAPPGMSFAPAPPGQLGLNVPAPAPAPPAPPAPVQGPFTNLGVDPDNPALPTTPVNPDNPVIAEPPPAVVSPQIPDVSNPNLTGKGFQSSAPSLGPPSGAIGPSISAFGPPTGPTTGFSNTGPFGTPPSGVIGQPGINAFGPPSAAALNAAALAANPPGSPTNPNAVSTVSIPSIAQEVAPPPAPVVAPPAPVVAPPPVPHALSPLGQQTLADFSQQVAQQNKGTLGTGITGFTPGSNLAAIANIAGPVTAIAIAADFPVSAAIAMQSLYSMPVRA